MTPDLLAQISQEFDRLWAALRSQQPPEIPIYVGARCYQTSAQSIPNVTFTPVNFNTVGHDSHNAVTTGPDWRYTCPIQGMYLVTTGVLFDVASWGSGTGAVLSLFRNGSRTSDLEHRTVYSTSTIYLQIAGAAMVRCNRGDTLSVRVYHTRGSPTSTLTGEFHVHIAIARIPGVYP
jgi:hypothetical protein